MVAAFAAVATAAPVGVSVNGVTLDSGGSSGEGWKYYAPHITLTNAGPFTISGTNKTSQVRVVVQQGVTCDVTLSNLVIEALGSSGQCAFTLETNACVSLFLAGSNALLSGERCAGLAVGAGRTLSITNAPGDDAGSLTATGGKYAAGIGGNNKNESGTITIHGGQITAYGTDGAAGIGGGSQGAGGTTTIHGGHVSASSTGNYGAGIGGGYYRAGGTITINGGTVMAQGGRLSAGIGGGYYHSGPAGTVAINGGTVTATGGTSGAGIGGGGSSQGSTVNVSGGVVTAQGGSSAAGIGGGQSGAGGNVAISGGRVTATGGTYGAGIGGGNSGAGGTVTISGGTVAATGSNGAKDIGPGQNGTVSGANTFTGGSIGLGATSAFYTPSNTTAQVFCASLTGFEPGSEVTINGLPDSFGANDIVADADGCIHLWLPNGTHIFEANGRECTVTIQDGVVPTGVTVNGQEIATAPAVPGAGWAYDAPNRTLSLTGTGPFTLSGTNVVGGVRVVVSSGVVKPVTLANLTLRMTGSGQCAFMLGTGANVSLVLAGTNALASGYNCAGIQVESGRTLSITNAPGDDAAALSVTGGRNAAGIGGGNSVNGGTVNILGGIVTAAGGNGASGIGGGFKGAGGTVSIAGGTVFAQGGNYASGIGGGGEKAGGGVTISGGRIAALGGSRGAGIGGGSYDGTGGAGGAVTISGGTVFAQGSDGGMDIGPGRDTTIFGANTFTGGSIRLADASLAPIPRNHNGKAVFCATVAGFEPGAQVVTTDHGNLPAYYGTADIVADDGGNIHLWIPNGTYTFTANGSTYTVELDDTAGATGVTVNGDEVAFGSDDPAAGWTYDEAAGLLRLTNAGPFTISGTNTEGKVRVVVNANLAPAVTLSNLTLRTSSDDRCIFTLGSGANVSLTLAGANELASGSGRPGIWVEAGETLSITNAPGDDAASLAVTGGGNGAGIGSGAQAAAGTVNIAGGTITATSGTSAAGIGGGYNRAGGTVNISGGTVTAVSTYSGAGIGGGMSGAGGTVNISGGTVTATGDNGGAGIGGGKSRAGGTVTISGGRVTATGRSGGAGIGGGTGSAGGTTAISGGTVTAAGSYSAADIGPGDGSTDASANTFTGGSILLVNDSIALDPSNNTDPVFCATLAGFTPNTAVAITGLAEYGVTDIAADNGGAIHLWLPDGDYNFTANGWRFVVTIQDGVVHILGSTGVTVNGEEIAFGSADPAVGWIYDEATGLLRLTNAGPFTLAGTNTEGKVCVVVPQGVTNEVTLSNLVLQASDEDQCVFALETNAVVSLSLAGECDLTSADYRAGVEVPAGASLTITNAPGDDAGALTVTGGYGGAGIGGGYDANGGAVTVNGGTLTVTGGFAGAGIGGGYNYSDIPNADTDSGGMVTVNGGAITVTSGNYAAGIGGGAFGGGGTVTVNGGVVTATSGYGGAGIGGGYNGIGGAVTINGGALTATGGYAGAGIGGGYNYSNIPNAETNSGGTVTINGGTVSAIGGRYAAGIGSGDYGGGGIVNISGGTVTATGGFDGAGIGGGYDGQGCTVTITGGGVSATGGDYAAGIGGGYTYNSTAATAAAGGTVAISGGRVMATGGRYAAGIGGGSGWTVEGGDGADLTVAGGTVFATGGADGGPGVGSGVGNVGNGGSAPHVSGTCTFTGGSIRIDGGYAATDPTDGEARVWCVTVTNLVPHAAVTVTSLGTYGVNDLFADENGRLYLWLPDNDYTFTAGGFGYTAAVNGADATATLYLAAPAFATDGSAIVVSGTTLSITIANAQSGAYYTLYGAPEPGGPWTPEQSVPATVDGTLTFTLSNMTAPKRFFKVEASTDQP